MALTKKEEKRIVTKIFGYLGAIVAIVFAVLGMVFWQMGETIMTKVDSGLVEQKIYFPPKGSPGFEAAAFPAAQKYAGKQVNDGPKAKAFAENYLDVRLKLIGGGKTLSEVGAQTAADPRNLALQQQQGAMFQLATSKNLLLTGAYGAWAQGQMMQMVGGLLLVGAVGLVLVAGVQQMRYKRL